MHWQGTTQLNYNRICQCQPHHSSYYGIFVGLFFVQGEHSTLEEEVETLRHDNAILKAEVERLQRENAELRAKLVRSGEASTL